MKFSCETSKLQKSISLVEKAVATRSSLQVLENIYFELKQGVLCLRGNDLEIGIENHITLEGETQEGQVLVKAKTISNIVNKLPHKTLQISVNENHRVDIKGEKVDFEILGQSTEEYPVFPSIEGGLQLKLKVQELRDLIKHTLFAVSNDETKQFLNGILIKVEADTVYFVATDGYRLSLKKHFIDPVQQGLQVIAPFKTVNELNRILHSEDGENEVILTLSENQVACQMETFILVSRVIKGQFPDYKQVIPSQTENEFIIPKRDFLEACERASIIASASNNVIRLGFYDEKLVLQANAAGLGEFKEEIEIKRRGGQGDKRVAFNVRLIQDAVKNMDQEDLLVAFNTELSPCKIVPVADDSFTYIIMPIRTSDAQESKPEAKKQEVTA